MKYIYESHMGGLFCSDNEIEDTYCEQCGDSDWLIGSASTAEEAWVLLEDKTSTFDDSKCENCLYNGNYDYCDEHCEEFSHSGGYQLGYVMNFVLENFEANNLVHEIYVVGRAKNDTNYVFVNYEPNGHEFGENHAIPIQLCISENYINQLARGLAFILDNPDYSTLRKITQLNSENRIIHIFEILEEMPEEKENWNNSAHYVGDGWYGYIKLSAIKWLPEQNFIEKYIK